MWQLDYPWLLLLVLLPGIGYRYLPTYREARSAVRVPFFAAMSQAVGQVPDVAGGTRNRGQLLLNAVVWVLLVLALARPVWIEPPIEHQQPVRDLMLAIDISQSMETRDFTDAEGRQVDRLSAVKQVVQGFIQRRHDDRLGLIVFGSGAYPQAPLTLDHASLAILLADTGIGMAGPDTAIGDA
ncbi:VWA domain-containing protein, partial [Pseudomonas gingeri]|uniref:VWA domain-containing protein n=2 Tax=Pseudomonas TaxID=286 RepID=UPI00210881EF